MSVIKDYFEDMRKGEAHPYWDEKIYQLALHDEKEKKVLIQIFNEETVEEDKVFLAQILARLGETFIIPFLVQVIENKSRMNTTAAFSLLRLQYFDIKNIFIKVLEDERNPRHWISRPLYCLNTPLANEILEELMKRDEKIRENIEIAQNDSDYKRHIEDNEW